jgi:exonuclease III
MEKHKMDVLGMAEININFKKVGPTQQWKDRFKKLRTNSHCATNEHTTSNEKRVFGGTAYLTSAAASHKVEKKGADPTNLGRWSWALLTGRQGIKTRIINGYRPIHDTTNRVGTVYSQQQKYFTDAKISKEPRQAFLDDLKQHVEQWRNQGENIILGLDLNDDTWDSDAASQIEAWGLLNALKE